MRHSGNKASFHPLHYRGVLVYLTVSYLGEDLKTLFKLLVAYGGDPSTLGSASLEFKGIRRNMTLIYRFLLQNGAQADDVSRSGDGSSLVSIG